MQNAAMSQETMRLSRRINPISSVYYTIDAKVVRVKWQVCDEWESLQYQRGKDIMHMNFRWLMSVCASCFLAVGFLNWVTGATSLIESGILFEIGLIGHFETTLRARRSKSRVRQRHERQLEILRAHDLPLDPSIVATDHMLKRDECTQYRYILRFHGA